MPDDELVRLENSSLRVDIGGFELDLIVSECVAVFLPVLQKADETFATTAVFSVADGFYYRLYRLTGNNAPAPIDLPYSSGDFAMSTGSPSQLG